MDIFKLEILSEGTPLTTLAMKIVHDRGLATALKIPPVGYGDVVVSITLYYFTRQYNISDLSLSPLNQFKFLSHHTEHRTFSYNILIAIISHAHSHY